MKLVILDGYTENPGDLSWEWLNGLVDEYIVYDRTAPDDVFERKHSWENVDKTYDFFEEG